MDNDKITPWHRAANGSLTPLYAVRVFPRGDELVVRLDLRDRPPLYLLRSRDALVAFAISVAGVSSLGLFEAFRWEVYPDAGRAGLIRLVERREFAILSWPFLELCQDVMRGANFDPPGRTYSPSGPPKRGRGIGLGRGRTWRPAPTGGDRA